jgi:hypothetical protein
MDEKHINWEFEDGKAFFAQEVSINFTPLHLVLDFKNITPRIDSRTRTGPVFKVEHDIVVLDLFQAKRFHALLSQVLDGYEKDFGKITKPKVIEKFEAKQKDKKEDKEKGPSYFG